MSERLLALLKRHGDAAVSFQALEPGLSHRADGESAIAYADTGGAWVTAGPPIAPPEARPAAMKRFCAAAEERGRRARFFGVESPPPPESGLGALKIGEQPTWRPSAWPETLRRVRSLREQLRRARAKGVRVRPVPGAELADPESGAREAIERLVARWRETRSMPPMEFLVAIDLSGFSEERRYFLAEREAEVVGLLIAVPIYATGGWFIEHILRDPDAPNGTVEALFDHAMREFAAEKTPEVTFGLAPLAGVSSRVLRAIRDRTRWLYDFEGLRAFKAKLRPDRWDTVYLAYPARERGARAVLDSLAAFAGGSFLRFGLRTLFHRAPTIVWLLAVLLLPWTAALAAAPAEHWFPSLEAKAAWIAYDAALFCGLVALARRWRRSLALALSAAAGLDFAVGLWQTAAFNAPRAAPADWIFILMALAAPLFAAIFLAATRDRALSSRSG